MTSKEVIEYIESNRIDKLYKKFENCFQIIDKWSDTFINGDLLDENSLSYALDQSTGVFAKLCSVANALEAYLDRLLYNKESSYYKSLSNIRTQDTAVAKAQARASVSAIREYLSDFRSYVMASQQNITTAQSRLKRLSVESSAKRIDFKGDKSNIPNEETAW